MGSLPKVIQYAIVTYARSWSALAAVRSLGKRGVRVVTGDCVPLGAATFSKYAESSFLYADPSNERKFIDDLLAKCSDIHKKTGANILLLPILEETYVVAKHKHSFPHYVHIELMESALLDKIQHKGELISIAKKYSVRSPQSWYVKSQAQALKLASKLPFPVYVKLPEGCGSVGIFKIDNQNQYEEKVKELSSSLVIQEFIPGEDYCACALFQHGKPVVIFTYTGIQTYPAKGGTTVYRKAIHEPNIEKEVIKLLGGLKWHGVAELDFRIDTRTKRPVLIEVNPRFWGGLNQAIKSNIDFPYLVWRMAEGFHQEKVKDFDKSVTTGNMMGSIASTIQELVGINYFKPSLNRFTRKPTPSNLFRVFKTAVQVVPAVRKYLVKRYVHNKLVDDVYDPDDPGAMAGMLFPLAVFAKYGKINTKLLVSSMNTEK